MFSLLLEHSYITLKILYRIKFAYMYNYLPRLFKYLEVQIILFTSLYPQYIANCTLKPFVIEELFLDF